MMLTILRISQVLCPPFDLYALLAGTCLKASCNMTDEAEAMEVEVQQEEVDKKKVKVGLLKVLLLRVQALACRYTVAE